MSTTTAPLTGNYVGDPVHSSFSFSVPYQGVSVFRGSLTEVAASLRDGRLEGSAKVESISIRTPEQFRAHVLGNDFFDAENHPEITFSSSDVNLADDGTATVNGELTIKGISRPIVATGRYQAPATDAFGNTRADLALETTVDRTEFDINWNMALPSGGNALSNDVTISVELSLIEEA